MKSKIVVLMLVLLVVAMVPAMAMAKTQAKPAKTGSVVLDMSQPYGPQLAAQLPGGKGSAPVGQAAPASRGASNQGIQPQAVYGLLNTSFEAPNWPSTSGNADGFDFFELGSPVGWDSTTLKAKRGVRSLYSAGYNNNPLVNPYYDNYMLSGAFYPMDLQGAKRVQVRFQYMNDSEYGYDYFLWCVSPDMSTLYCDYHTGSTNDTWRLVQLDSRNNPYLADALNSPDTTFGVIFYSDSSVVDRGAFVDVARIRAWGP
jgi:hypothetical protein